MDSISSQNNYLHSVHTPSTWESLYETLFAWHGCDDGCLKTALKIGIYALTVLTLSALYWAVRLGAHLYDYCTDSPSTPRANSKKITLAEGASLKALLAEVTPENPVAFHDTEGSWPIDVSLTPSQDFVLVLNRDTDFTEDSLNLFNWCRQILHNCGYIQCVFSLLEGTTSEFRFIHPNNCKNYSSNNIISHLPELGKQKLTQWWTPELLEALSEGDTLTLNLPEEILQGVFSVTISKTENGVVDVFASPKAFCPTDKNSVDYTLLFDLVSNSLARSGYTYSYSPIT